MSPNDRRFRVAREYVPHLIVEERRPGALGEGNIDVAMEDDRHPDFTGEVENPVQCGIEESRRIAGDFSRHEFLMDAEFADAAEHSRIHLKHPADMIDGVHVGRVEAGDHRIEPRTIFRRQREIFVRDHRIGEGVIIKRCVGLQIIGRRDVTGIEVGPGLLQRDSEKGRPFDGRSHHFHIFASGEPLLHIVRQMEMSVVEQIALAARGAERSRRGYQDADAERSEVRNPPHRERSAELRIRVGSELAHDVRDRALAANAVAGGVKRRSKRPNAEFARGNAD